MLGFVSLLYLILGDGLTNLFFLRPFIVIIHDSYYTVYNMIHTAYSRVKNLKTIHYRTIRKTFWGQPQSIICAGFYE